MLLSIKASLEVIEPSKMQLWFAGKLMLSDRKLGEIVGNNEKTKIIIKLSKINEGAPSREPVMSEEAKKQLTLHAYRRQEELKVGHSRLEREYPRHFVRLFNSNGLAPLWA